MTMTGDERRLDINVGAVDGDDARFASVLFRDAADRPSDASSGTPGFFVDLNLDQIVAAVTAGKDEYDLTPFFHAPLHDADAVSFRHEVMRDLEDPCLFGKITTFARSMQEVRKHLAQLGARYYEHQKERWFLDAVNLYCGAVTRLVEDLSAATFGSRGLRAFRGYLEGYASSRRFTALMEEGKQLEAALCAIRYDVFIRGPRVEVRNDAGCPDYSVEVQATFERFRQGTVKEYRFSFDTSPEINHIEAQILDGVALLHKETFSKLAAFYAAEKDFLDPTVAAFDREIQFYVAYLEYIAQLKKAGLDFCYPSIAISRKEVYDYDGFDLALAGKLLGAQAAPVCNDFHLRDPERIIVVSGPNQGGKTTFARTFGQLHYLASLGCPVPGRKARLYLADRIFTHFEREERMTSLRGKLEDDLVRIHEILQAATPRSIIVINEIFASTALRDAILLSRRIAAAIAALDALCVWVTFLDEVASSSEKAVSMVSTVVPENPAQRTFRIVRRRADGLAYALSIAEKHRLSYAMIKERIGS
jgi:DNA mismatch repair ATPase MutS